MENKCVCKELEVCVERLPLNVSNHENSHETKILSLVKEPYSQNTLLVDNFSNEIRTKKTVSFSDQSSILYFDNDQATSILQNSFSEVINLFDDTPQTDNMSHSETDVVVALEKLPQTLMEEYVSRSSIHIENCQRIALPTVSQNGVENCNSDSEPFHNEEAAGNISISKSVLMQELDKNACSKDNVSPLVPSQKEFPKRELKILVQRLPDNLLEMHQNYINAQISPEKNSSGISSVITYSENIESERHTPKRKSKQKVYWWEKKKKKPKIKNITIASTHKLFTEQNPSNQKFSDLSNKRLCVHLEKLDLEIPEIDTTDSSGHDLLIECRKGSISQVSGIKPSISANSSKNSLSCIIDDSSSDDDLPLLLLANKSCMNQHIVNANSITNSQNKSGHSEECLLSDTEDYIPLSCLKSVNYVNLPTFPISITKNLHNMPNKEILSSASDHSSEENYPLSLVSKIHAANTTLLANSSKTKNKDGKFCINFSLSNMKRVNKDPSKIKSLESLMKNIRLDHTYHLPLNKMPIESTSSTNNQTVISKTKILVKKKQFKPNGNVLKNKKARKETNSTVLVNTVLQNKNLSSKSNEDLNAKSKNNKAYAKKSAQKKKKLNKKAMRKRKAEIYKMFFKYLCKQTKLKSKGKFKKSKKSKNSLIEQSKDKQLQPLNIKVEPESNCSVPDADEISETKATCSENGLSTVLSTENAFEVAPEALSFVDISQNESTSKKNKVQERAIDRCQLDFLSKNKSLKFYNKFSASERLLLTKYEINKKQRKQLKRMLKKLKKRIKYSDFV